MKGHGETNMSVLFSLGTRFLVRFKGKPTKPNTNELGVAWSFCLSWQGHAPGVPGSRGLGVHMEAKTILGGPTWIWTFF